MSRIELKNGAVFGSPVVSVFLTTSPSNPLTDDELITCASEHFSKWFGDIPWWIGVSRGKSVSRKTSDTENIVIVLQKASKMYWHITDPKHVFYNRDGVIDKDSIELAISSAKSRCMVPVVPIKNAPVRLLQEPVVKLVTPESVLGETSEGNSFELESLKTPAVDSSKLTSEENPTSDFSGSENTVNISVEDAAVRSYANTQQPSAPKKAKKKVDLSNRSMAAWAAMLSEL